jgi:hypothetical protein
LTNPYVHDEADLSDVAGERTFQNKSVKMYEASRHLETAGRNIIKEKLLY